MASVKRRPDGKWRARYRDVDGRERAKHTATKREAEAWLHERMAAQQRGEHIDHDAARQTVRGYFDAWSVRQVWIPSTLASYQTMMKGCTFADVALARVQRSHVETWVRHLQVQGLAPRTIRQRHSYMANMLGSATRDRVIAHNPATGVALPRPPRRDAEMTIPTQEQVGVLLNAVEPRLRAAIAVGAFAGLRIGEVCALQLGDVDFLRRTLHVRRQVRPGGEVAPPKYESIRAVAAPDTLLEILARHAEVHGVGSGGWLFPGRFDGPTSSSATRRAWIASLQPGWTFDFHDLRHFYASGLIAAGCDVVTVQRALGHSNPSITLNTYSHLWPTAEDRTRAAAEELARASCGLDADQGAHLPRVSGVSPSRG
jgi:integrase